MKNKTLKSAKREARIDFPNIFKRYFFCSKILEISISEYDEKNN